MRERARERETQNEKERVCECVYVRVCEGVCVCVCVAENGACKTLQLTLMLVSVAPLIPIRALFVSLSCRYSKSHDEGFLI